MGYWKTIAETDLGFGRYSDYAMQLMITGYAPRNQIFTYLISEGVWRDNVQAPESDVHIGKRYRARAVGIYKDRYGKEFSRDVTTSYITFGSNPDESEREITDLTPDRGSFNGDISVQVYVPTPPSMPSSIAVLPEIVKEGEKISISWGSGSYATSYRLERSVNGGSYTQIYSGTNRNYTDTALPSWNTVTYRVRGYNVDGYSSYRTSDTIIVTHFPEMGIKVSGALKTSEMGWVKVNGELREIDSIHAKVNGVLREVE